MEFKTLLNKSPIIATVEPHNIEDALDSSASLILLINASIGDILDEKLKEINKIKPILIHTDLVKGISREKEGIEFVCKHMSPFGIVSTKSNVIRAAKRHNVLTVQRIFLIDTSSLSIAISNIKQNDPDVVEVMPGIATSIIGKIKESIDKPIIVGGLISQEDQIDKAIEEGVDGISLSNNKLWNYKVKLNKSKQRDNRDLT